MKRTTLRTCAAVWTAVAALLLPLGSTSARVPADRLEILPAPARDVRPAADRDPSSVIVKYRDGAAKSELAREEVRAVAGATLSRSYASLPDLESLALPEWVTVDEAVAALASDPRVEFAEPNYTVEAHALPNDPAFGAQWGLHNTGQSVNNYPSEGAGIDVDAPEAWEYGTGSEEVVVAIIDEGLDVTHPDIAPNAWTNPGETPGNRNDDDGNGLVDDVHGWDFLNDDASVFDGANDQSNNTDFHGTHTSGTVGAVGNNGIGLTGVCWNVRLMSLKFLSNGGVVDNAVACIDYVVRMKQRGVNVRAINASWGGPGNSQALRAAIAVAGEAGILFCASSGNGGDDGRGDDNDLMPSYPASFDLPNIISVGAWTRYDQNATFSNYGATSVDLLAPGGLIASTGPNGSYYYSSGTSMAAPHVAGAVALIASLAPSLSAAQIKEIILSTTVPVPFARPTVTGGRLDLDAAVRAALGDDGEDPGGGDPPPPPPPPPPPAPVVQSAKFDKKRKTLFVEGRELRETAVIEVDGVALPNMVFAPRDRLSDGTYVRVGGRAPKLKRLLPKGRAVAITVYDSETGVRSAPLQYRR